MTLTRLHPHPENVYDPNSRSEASLAGDVLSMSVAVAVTILFEHICRRQMQQRFCVFYLQDTPVYQLKRGPYLTRAGRTCQQKDLHR